MFLEIIINKLPLTSERTQNICNARNFLIKRIYEIDKIIPIDYYIMMYFDVVCSKPINCDALINAFKNKDKWNSITFNIQTYYDFWALSFDHYIYSCWHFNEPKSMIKFMRDDLL